MNARPRVRGARRCAACFVVGRHREQHPGRERAATRDRRGARATASADARSCRARGGSRSSRRRAAPARRSAASLHPAKNTGTVPGTAGAIVTSISSPSAPTMESAGPPGATAARAPRRRSGGPAPRADARDRELLRVLPAHADTDAQASGCERGEGCELLGEHHGRTQGDEQDAEPERDCAVDAVTVVNGDDGLENGPGVDEMVADVHAVEAGCFRGAPRPPPASRRVGRRRRRRPSGASGRRRDPRPSRTTSSGRRRPRSSAVAPLAQHEVAAVQGAAVVVAEAGQRSFVAFRHGEPLHLLKSVLHSVARALGCAGQSLGDEAAKVVAQRGAMGFASGAATVACAKVALVSEYMSMYTQPSITRPNSGRDPGCRRCSRGRPSPRAVSAHATAGAANPSPR